MIAVKEKYKVEPNRELIGLGLANIAGSFFSAYPVTGGFSRTAVNYQAGAKTGLASIVTVVIILLTLLFFTSFF
jgi:SulP family sulfate permease